MFALISNKFWSLLQDVFTAFFVDNLGIKKGKFRNISCVSIGSHNKLDHATLIKFRSGGLAEDLSKEWPTNQIYKWGSYQKTYQEKGGLNWKKNPFKKNRFPQFLRILRSSPLICLSTCWLRKSKLLSYEISCLGCSATVPMGAYV